MPTFILRSYFRRTVLILQQSSPPTKKNPLQTANNLNPHIMTHLKLSGFHDWNHHLINQISSPSFQNKISMIFLKSPIILLPIKNIIYSPTTAQSNSQHSTSPARQQWQSDNKCNGVLCQIYRQSTPFDQLIKILFCGLKEKQVQGNILMFHVSFLKRN